jgi:hypothetical protein
VGLKIRIRLIRNRLAPVWTTVHTKGLGVASPYLSGLFALADPPESSPLALPSGSCFARAAEWLAEGLEAPSLSDAVADESSADSPDHADRS